MNTVTQVRQGDILLVFVPNPPVNLERKSTANGTVTVGYGEVTGHHHTIQNAAWFVAPETTMDDLHQFALGTKTLPVFVVADETTEIRHQEHAPIVLSPGTWQVLRQREYTPERIVSVID